MGTLHKNVKIKYLMEITSCSHSEKEKSINNRKDVQTTANSKKQSDIWSNVNKA